MNQKGVTMIELIIVLVIIAIGATLMIPNIGGWIPSYRLRSAARDVVSSMRTAQMRAVSYNGQYGVAFDTTNQQFQIYRNSGGLQADGPLSELPSGVTFNSITGLPTTGPGGQPLITFSPDSTASATGTITLRNNKGRERTIQISRTTGRVTIQ